MIKWRIDASHPTPSLREIPAAFGGRECTGDVREAMLAELREFDPGDDGERPNPRRKCLPHLGRIAVTTQPPKQTGSLHEDPLLSPR